MEEELRKVMSGCYKELHKKEVPYIEKILKLLAEDKSLTIYETKNILKLCSDLIDAIALFA